MRKTPSTRIKVKAPVVRVTMSVLCSPDEVPQVETELRAWFADSEASLFGLHTENQPLTRVPKAAQEFFNDSAADWE